MTTEGAEEKAFNDALDTAPDNDLARAVYADWLQDRGDPRGPGYRALARLRRRAGKCSLPRLGFIWGNRDALGADNLYFSPRPHCGLPDVWFKHLPIKGNGYDHPHAWSYYPTRRAAEDAAALAYSALSSQEIELLEAPPL